MERLHYLETGSTDPAYNLAFEEYVLTHRMDGDYLILWQNDNTVVVGQNQNTAAEINRAFVEAHGVHVVRRTTGGGAVYHDLGNLNYSFITDEEAGSLRLERFTAPVVDALASLGLQAEASGRNDILVEGRKVSGTAQRVYKTRILHHGTLLFDSDPDMVAGALNVDPEKFRSKGRKSVRSRIGNIRSFLKQDMTLQDFWAHLRVSLGKTDVAPEQLTAEELAQVQRLKEEKYDTWEWTYGRSPRYNYTSKRRWPGGNLEVYAEIHEGKAEQIRFYGDFMAAASMDAVPSRPRSSADLTQRRQLSPASPSRSWPPNRRISSRRTASPSHIKTLFLSRLRPERPPQTTAGNTAHAARDSTRASSISQEPDTAAASSHHSAPPIAHSSSGTYSRISPG